MWTVIYISPAGSLTSDVMACPVPGLWVVRIVRSKELENVSSFIFASLRIKVIDYLLNGW